MKNLKIFLALIISGLLGFFGPWILIFSILTALYGIPVSPYVIDWVIMALALVVPILFLYLIVKKLKLEKIWVYFVIFAFALGISIFLIYLTSARGVSSQSSRRLADVRQLASAIELYYNDKNFYPNNLNDLVPNYIGLIPKRELFKKYRHCNQENEKYVYTQLAQNQYKLTFCLEEETGGYKPGIHILTQDGIK